MLCFRLHFTKDSTTINTAAATVRQLVSVVFESVMTEDAVPGVPVVGKKTQVMKAKKKSASVHDWGRIETPGPCTFSIE